MEENEYLIEFIPKAINDLEQIYLYIANELFNPGAAQRLEEIQYTLYVQSKLLKALDDVDHGRTLDAEEMNKREVFLHRYRLMYQVQESKKEMLSNCIYRGELPSVNAVF